MPGYTVATTPLPDALPLFATGLGALGLLGWRRKRHARAVAQWINDAAAELSITPGVREANASSNLDYAPSRESHKSTCRHRNTSS